MGEALAGHERFVAYSCYARQLAPWRETYGASRILPVFFERMIAFPDAELERICAFIGDPTPGARTWDREQEPRNVSSERMRQSRLRTALQQIPGASALMRALPESARASIRSLWQIRKRPELDSGLRVRLEEELDRDLEILSSWLGLEPGRPLTSAGWKQQVLERGLEWRDDL